MNALQFTFWAALLAAVGGCASPAVERPAASNALYFNSPREAVPVIADLLRKEDFATLARYYDLSGSGVRRADLLSGEFFIRKDRPPGAHPGGFWRYKHPFAPAFKYHSQQPTARPGVFVVRVMVEIDQGAGQPVQRGFDQFLMRRSPAGWQVLPDEPMQETRQRPAPPHATISPLTLCWL